MEKEHLCFAGSGREEDDKYVHILLPTSYRNSSNMSALPEENISVSRGVWEGERVGVARRVHLCFVGSGREVEDRYARIVVANSLQKHQQYVSFTRGGYFYKLMSEALGE